MGIGIWHKFALTGGGATALDGIAIAEIVDSDVCHVYAAGKFYYMVFDADATDAENSPLVIRPDDYSTAGVWKLAASPYGDVQVQPEIVSGLAITGGISGGDVTVSGNTLTITPTTCLDSGLTTKLYTSVNTTCVIPSVANTDYYVFLVKLASGGAFEFRAYTTLVGVASDAQVSKYRFITWCKTNGSSVVMPYRQINNRIDWTTSSKPVLITSTTASYVAYNIGTAIPVSILESLILTNHFAGTQIFSYDGITDCGKLHATGASLSIQAVSSLYAKHDPTSYPIYAQTAFLRR